MSKEKEEKLKALKLTVDKLDKTYGKGTVMKLGDRTSRTYRSYFYGLTRSGYSTWYRRLSKRKSRRNIWTRIIRKNDFGNPCHSGMPKAGGIAAFIDAEHAFDRFYAEGLRS